MPAIATAKRSEPAAGQLAFSFACDLQVIPQADGSVKVRRGALKIQGGTRQAAKVLGCSQPTIRRMIDEGLIRARKIRPGRRNSKLIVEMQDVYALSAYDDPDK